MMELRQYQIDVIDQLSAGFRDGHTRQILMLATGSGKTSVAGEMIRRAAERGHRSIFVVERIELAGQAMRHLESLGLPVGLMQGENTLYRDTDVAIVASIQTLSKRGIPENIRLIVVDEAHILHRAHQDLIERYSAVPVIGLTATPLRKGLAKIYSRLVKGPAIADLVRDRYLVPVKAYGPSQDKIEAVLSGVGVNYQPGGRDFINKDLSRAMNRKELVGDIISTWLAKAAGLPTLVFAVDIAHSRAVVDDFAAEGIAAEHVDAYTDAEDRKAIIGRFRSGETTVLSSVSVLAVGFDVPIAACAILARPTLSLALHIQQCGRVMRPADGKAHALILDHAANFARHGRPESFDVEILDDGEIAAAGTKRTSEELVPCSACGFLLERSRRECPACGNEKRRVNQVHAVDGDLVEIDGADRIAGQVSDRRSFYLMLRHIGIDRGWSSKAAAAQYRERFNEWPPFSWNDSRPILPDQATLRWVQSRMIAFAKKRERQSA